ncbi:MAG: YHYH protein [Bacteroidota bacterium]
MKIQYFFLPVIFLSFFFLSCKKDRGITDVDPPRGTDCTDHSSVVDISERGACNQQLNYSSSYAMSQSNGYRTITSNSIPEHAVGLFGGGNGSLNPNAIRPNNGTYRVPISPTRSASITYLLNQNTGPQYQFGILLNGVMIDPEAAEPWPHERGASMSQANWEWNLDAMSINLGLDCNNAHVQPTGKYHYHGAPTLYLESLHISDREMTLIGYAADGFPIYYNYGYKGGADDNPTEVIELQSSYRLRTGDRPGNGTDAPCGAYSGIYTGDYEYVEGLGDLDKCNGRTGVTPEYPDGTYYYVISQNQFPYAPRCLVGTPSDDFKLR